MLVGVCLWLDDVCLCANYNCTRSSRLPSGQPEHDGDRDSEGAAGARCGAAGQRTQLARVRDRLRLTQPQQVTLGFDQTVFSLAPTGNFPFLQRESDVGDL